jgi:hypothetical protein
VAVLAAFIAVFVALARTLLVRRDVT